MKEIIEAFAARIKSPVFGYFILAWLAINWKPLFFLFFDLNQIDERIELFEKLTSIYTLAVLPFVVAAVAAVLYPWVNYTFLWICRKPTDLRNSIQAESEHKLLLKKKQLEETRSLILATRERELIDRAKRDEEIKSISDKNTKESLQNQIDHLRKELDIQNDLINKTLLPTGESENLHETYKRLAQLLQKAGRFDEAEQYLKKAIEIEKIISGKVS